ncbi:MAG: hypothetical protein ACPGUV_01505 [Polyangiales bacterium]
MKIFQRLLRLRNAAGVEYAVVGGHAVMLYGYPRSTDDLDILFVQSEANAARLAQAIKHPMAGVVTHRLIAMAGVGRGTAVAIVKQRAFGPTLATHSHP